MSFVNNKVSNRLIELLLDISGDDEDYTKNVLGIAYSVDGLQELLTGYIETKQEREGKVDLQQVIKIALYFAKNGQKAWDEYNKITGAMEN